jgi:DnaJ-class molecular chaperone
VADAYEILGLTRNSSEADIRQRYLELVRQYPPERAPEQFAAIRKAYEQLRDPVERLRTVLFDVGGDDSMPAILADVRRRLRSARIPTQVLLSLAERP